MRLRLHPRFTSQEFWRNHEAYRPATHKAVRTLTRQILDEVARHAPLPPHSRVLDVGAGNGAFTLGWAEKHEVVALDYSHGLLLENPVPARVEASVFQLPFADGTFDLVFFGAVLHHVADVSRALVEMRRVSRTYVAGMEPNRNNPAMAAFGLAKAEERGLLPFTAKWLRNEATAARLSVQICKPFGWILPNKTPELFVPMFSHLPMEHPLSFHLIMVARK